MTIVRALSAIALAAAGCASGPLIEDHGHSNHAAFATQAPPRPEGPARAAPGLDSQEAAIIADTYRQGLAAKEKKAKEQPVLIVAPPTRERAEMPAPSVPKER